MDSLRRRARPRTALICMSFICMPMVSSLAGADPATARDDSDHRCGGEPCAAVVRGLFGFFDRDLGLGGNGRSCADCHMATERFGLTPAAAESRYQHLLKRRERYPNADDPLFRPIDADDFRVNGEQASDYSNLRE